MLNFDRYEVLSFDCYGTLIDWESGIWAAFQPALMNHQVPVEREHLLELYGEAEHQVEMGEYREYHSVMRETFELICSRLGFVPTQRESESFVQSVKDWPPFPDSVNSLKTLKKKYKLAVISNIDDDLFALSARRLQVEFDWVITAQQVRSYKPCFSNFELALQRIGLPIERILHVAQSLFHDIVPAKALGLSTVWVNRRHDQKGFGATYPATGVPDLEVPDLETFVTKIGLT